MRYIAIFCLALPLGVGCGTNAPETTRPSPPLASQAASPTSAQPRAPAPVSTPEASVRPGVNNKFTSPTLDVAGFRKRFASESREVFRLRSEIVSALGLEPGMTVADIGAGTGIFVEPLAAMVGPTGKVFAIDISPKFLAFLRRMADERQWPHVRVVAGTAKQVPLPPNSIDMAFTCDTYHHFEFPRTTLASIHTALKPGGSLVVIDFKRIPGVSSKWILGHVRAGQETVTDEITKAGFELAETLQVGLKENYALRFVRK